MPNRSRLYFLLLCVLLLGCVVPSLTKNLKMVVYITRHGARAPSDDYFEEHKDYWGKRVSEAHDLTEVGMRQHYLLGSLFRKRYTEDFKLISPIYKENEIRIIASPKQRTIYSALAHSIGLYPLGTGPNLHDTTLNENLNPPWFQRENPNAEKLGMAVFPGNYQPVPITIGSDVNDTLFHSYTASVCPNRAMLVEKQLKSDLYIDLERNMSSVLDELANITSMNRESLNLSKVKTLVSNLNCDVYDGRESHVDFKSSLGKKMTLLQNFYIFYALFGSESLVKLGATPLLSEIINHFNNSAYNKSQSKLVFYSAHDYNLVSLLRGLNLANWQCVLDSLWSGTSMNDHQNCASLPEFASSMNFELYEEGGAYFVKLVYNGEEMDLCNRSDRFCTLEEFTVKARNAISDDFISLCGQEILHDVHPERHDLLILLVYAILFMALALFCYKGLKELNVLRKYKIASNVPYVQELASQDLEGHDN